MKYAIVESGGKQYRAVEGGTLEVDRLPVNTGDNIKLEQVLLLADGENITVGTPVIKDSPIWTKVVEHFKGEKVTIFNYSPKKRIRVKTGHRQNYTRLLVEQIGGATLQKKEPVKVEKAAEVEAAAPKAKAAKAAPATEKKSTTSAAPKAKAAPAKAKTPSASSEKKAATAAATPKKTTATTAKPKATTTKAATKSPAKGTSSPKKTSSTKKPAAK